jgi:hypothetical protein
MIRLLAYCYIYKNNGHPGEHKMATFKNWIYRLHKLPLNEAIKNKELNTVINIAENNGYIKEQIKNLYNQIKQTKKNKLIT